MRFSCRFACHISNSLHSLLVDRNSHVIPLQIPCKSHFSPIIWNGLRADLERIYNGGRTLKPLEVNLLVFGWCNTIFQKVFEAEYYTFVEMSVCLG